MAHWCRGKSRGHAGIGNLNPAQFRAKTSHGEEGNGKQPHKIHFPRKQLAALSLVSAKLKIKYAMEFYEYTIGAECNREPQHKTHFPRKSSEPCLWFLLSSKSSMLRNSMKILLVRKATGSHLINSISLQKDTEPCFCFLFSVFCCLLSSVTNVL